MYISLWCLILMCIQSFSWESPGILAVLISGLLGETFILMQYGHGITTRQEALVVGTPNSYWDQGLIPCNTCCDFFHRCPA